MAFYRIKIVPRVLSPNADGEWRTIEFDLPEGACWLGMAMAASDQVPGTHFLAAVERVTPEAGA